VVTAPVIRRAKAAVDGEALPAGTLTPTPAQESIADFLFEEAAWSRSPLKLFEQTARRGRGLVHGVVRTGRFQKVEPTTAGQLHAASPGDPPPTIVTLGVLIFASSTAFLHQGSFMVLCRRTPQRLVQSV
jgi:hypothetical protein